MVVTGNLTYTTISEEKFSTIRKRIGALRRMRTETLLGLCHTYYAQFEDTYMQNKGDTFPYILQHEFGWQAMEAYHNELDKRKAQRARGKRGQLRLL